MTSHPQRTKRAPVPQSRKSRRAVPVPPQQHEGGPQRIAKLLARAGIASRREVERMIAEGRIALNGEKITTPATLLNDVSGLTVDGRPVRPAKAARLYRFYKPQRTLTAAHDPKGRPTIYDKLPKGLPRLMPVGRLDFLTEGLLLLTNDGELKRQLELPRTGVVRTYRARAFGTVTQAQQEDLSEGITIDGIHYGSINANLERRTGRNCWIEMSLTEGKNREVRRVLEDLGLQVSRLIRTAYGPLTLDGLEPGQVDEVDRDALDQFRKTLK
jgi:23S rRNA pseudouridine2605 synthase